MQGKEEEYAYGLYLHLSKRFASIESQIELTVEGSFQNWRCIVKRAQQVCVVHCFEANKAPDYLTRFSRETEVATEERNPKTR